MYIHAFLLSTTAGSWFGRAYLLWLTSNVESPEETLTSRPSPPNPDARYFSRLTRNIESSKKISGEKVVIVTHSMGGNLMYYFFQWVQEHRSPKWVDQHVLSLVSIASPFLGTPKGISALLSGEAKDTAEMGLLGSVLDHHITP